MQEITDSEIILMAKDEQKANEALRLLMRKYKVRIYNHIRGILISHEDSDDVTQDVFIKVWQNISTFRGDSSLFTWIYRIATNESLNHIRKNRKKKLFASENQEQYLLNLLSNETYINSEEIQMKLQKAIIKLPDQQRLIFNMRYFDHIKFKEMAEILELTEGGVKSNYHIAEKKIKEFLKEH